jgi:hypothetical protein
VAESKRHRHEFTALYSHFGPYGRQDVHLHLCFDEDCHRVLVGDGRDCDGKAESHHRETLRFEEARRG